jgi:hypothetical protein
VKKSFSAIAPDGICTARPRFHFVQKSNKRRIIFGQTPPNENVMVVSDCTLGGAIYPNKCAIILS